MIGEHFRFAIAIKISAMKNVCILSAIALVFVLALNHAHNRTQYLAYLSTCVDAIAKKEGAANMTPSQKWETFAPWCAEVQN